MQDRDAQPPSPRGLSTIAVDEERFAPVVVAEDEGWRRRWPGSRAAPIPAAPSEPPSGPRETRVYRSADYEAATNRIDLTIEIGASSITVR